MNHVLTQEQFEQMILEEISYKGVKKFLKEWIIPDNKFARWAMLIYLAGSFGIKILPNEAKDGFLTDYVVYRVDNLENVDSSYDPIKKAKDNVIQKVSQSKIIQNRAEVVERIRKCPIKIGNTFFGIPQVTDALEGSNAIFFNLGKDYVLVNLEVDYDMEHTLVHELNHLVQAHARNKNNDKISTEGLTKSLTKEEFLDFFQGWKNFDKKHMKKKYNEDQDLNSVVWKNTMSDEKYYLGDHEIYSRISNLKSWCVKNGIIDFNDDLNADIISKIKDYANTLECKEYINFRQIDFMMILPFIDWDNKAEDINLIAMNKDSKKTLA